MMIKKKLKKMQCMWNRVRKPVDISELSVSPYSRKMGSDRGTPIDRIYIEKFLQEHDQYITGTVMEIADDTYTKKYGTHVKQILMFTANEKATSNNTIIGDLQSGDGVQDGLVDCFILTQTLPFIFDVTSTCKNIIKMLKPGGVALLTVRGISAISRYDEKRWGDYWSFTKQSLEKLFTIDGVEVVDLVQYGNVKTAVGFMLGLASEELSESDFNIDDELYPVILGIAVKRL